MVTDRLLSQFQWGDNEGVYRIGQYTPVSIRDQIVRATYLVQRLIDCGRLKYNTRVVVVGAGAAGVTAAINATDRTTEPIILIDVDDRALSLQAQCDTRWLDPVQYDWPARHWDSERWPIHEDVPRTQTAASYPPPTTLQAAYATAWSAQFQALLEPYLLAREIKFLSQSFALPWVPLNNGRKRVRVLDHAHGTTHDFDADILIWAGGFGAERCTLPMPNVASEFRGINFWDSDAFELPNFGLNQREHPILVSGAGDGALQDYIRLVSGLRSARAVWSELAPLLGRDSVNRFEELWHWDETSRRFSEADYDPENRCEWQRRLHRRYKDVVWGLDDPDWTSVCDALDKHIGSRPIQDVFLAVKHDHFDVCYPLNRAVSLILARYVERRSGKLPILFDTAIKSTVHLGGAKCSMGCWGHEHDVELVKAGCLVSPAALQALNSTPPKRFSGLVVRHGIDPLEISGLPPSLHPQEVPAHLP